MFKKAIRTMAMTGALILTMVWTTPATSIHAENITGTVTASVLNVRSGASTSYDKIGKVTKGTKVEILSESNGWYEIKYTEDYTGWSCADYISKSSTSLLNVVKTMEVKATAYSGDTITSTGTVPKYGTIAVDPSVIPYGTKVYIPEFDDVFTAEDCGGAIKGNRIDIFMDSESQCNNWGVRNITIQILE